MSRRRVPRLSEHYETAAHYFWTLGQEHSVWFYLMAAWFYEDEDEKEWNGGSLTVNEKSPRIGAQET